MRFLGALLLVEPFSVETDKKDMCNKRLMSFV